MRIDKVYTRGGDAGETSLIGGERVSKASPRIECYGTVDELNATLGLLGMALDASAAGPHLLPIIRRVQNELFNLGALLATADAAMRSKLPPLEERHVAALERDIDAVNDELPPLRSFVLPGGGWPSAYCHLARTVCRRAERLVVSLSAAASDAGPGSDAGPASDAGRASDDVGLRYLNRLSDALFVWGRYCALKDGQPEPLWEPKET
ncbi:MAG TPA: cob(I)yrinic acid a,c-diamide adenosyltransferase [Kofleriaceae bacterium]|nr:cob(I)yrinic acid a,c-diamide adenosyltransferase [Kofleriaceae bacterium]